MRINLMALLILLTCTCHSQSIEIDKNLPESLRNALAVKGLDLTKYPCNKVSIFPKNDRLIIQAECDIRNELLECAIDVEMLKMVEKGILPLNSFCMYYPSQVLADLGIFMNRVYMRTQNEYVKDAQFNLIFNSKILQNSRIIFYASFNGYYRGIDFRYCGKPYSTLTIDPYAMTKEYRFKIGETSDLQGANNANYYLTQFLSDGNKASQ